MYYDVLPLNVRGVPIPTKQRSRAKRIRADINIHWARLGPDGRDSLYAFSLNAHHDLEKLLPLWDVRIEGMATLGLVLEGTEFIDGQPYPQQWHCRPLADQFVIPWTTCPRSSLDGLI